MKIGIHHTDSTSFSDRWIKYCESKNIPYKVVNCYASDIIDQLEDCDALMWHFHHISPKDFLFAKELIYSVQFSGKAVFPDLNTMWHFDDKLGQKYLLEAIGAPLVPSTVFYDKNEAIKWANSTTYPKVFKLRTGGGSQNVRLVNNRLQAKKLIRKAFGSGFSQYAAWSNMKERIRKYRLGLTSLYDVIKGIIRLGYPTKFSRAKGKEKGYVYFQDFIPENDYDIRIIIIDEKAFAIKRMVRKNDFRASGSGAILYEKDNFSDETVRLSFDLATKLKGQSVAFDYVYKDGKPILVEISYCFIKEVYDPCTGYWDKDLNWYEGKFNPYAWMVESVLEAIKNSDA